MLDLGELILHINADSSGAESAIGGLSASIGTGLSGAAGLAVAAVGMAVDKTVEFGKSCVSAGMSFDSAMSQVAATMGKTTDEIQDLRDFALEMGSTTAFSATEAAEALNYMALAGYDSETSMKMLPNVLNLAAAGNMDLARASDMVTDAQSALGLSLEETETMVDQIAKTSSTTNTSVEQLGDAFLTVGSTAASLKIPTSEMSQTLGILADNGIKGSEAGTKYRNMLLSLSNPTDKAAAQLDALGVSVFDSSGEMRSMQDIIGDLNVALDGMTDEQRTQAIGAIFNKTDLAAVNALLNTNEERWNEVAEAIDDCQGAAEKMAETQLDNLEGDVTLFKSALEGLQIAISDGVTPALRDFVQFGTEELDKLRVAFQEGGFSGFAEQLGVTLGEAVGKVAEYIPKIVEAAGQFIKGFISGISQSGPEVLNTIGTMIQDMIQKIIEKAPEMIAKGMEMIQNFIQGLAQAVPDIVSTAAELISSLVNGLANPEGIQGIVEAAIDLITNLVTSLLENAPMLIEAGLNLIVSLVEGLVGAIPKLVEALPQIIEAIVTTIIESLPKILEAGIQIIGALIEGIISLVPQIPGLLLDVVKAIFTGIVDALKSLFGIHSPSTVMAELGMNMIQGLIEGIGELIGDLIENVTEWFTSVKDKITEIWEGVKEKATELWTNIKDTVVEKATELKDQLFDKVSDMKDKVVDKFNDLKDKAIDKFNDLKEKVTDKVSDMKDKVQDKFSDMKDKVVDKVQDLKEKVNDKWQDIKEKTTDTVNDIKERVSDKFNDVKDKVADTMSDMKDKVRDGWDKATDIIKNTDLYGAAKNVLGSFLDGLKGAWDNITSWASSAVDSLKSAIGGAVDWVKSKVSGSHRTGLSEVPYDGYIAELHKGEQVLTAAEANQYQRMMQMKNEQGNQTVINFNGNYKFDDQKDIDYFMTEAGKLIKRKVG